ncbi:hypothetical protein BS50DRAFT_501689 [Corynespora cassiicola Philippines]|uniref:Uncharacterized protein n=1 Tax=Corynespora cassiicola Philippines TaxID=1448308 RepID=A0A2T2NBE0_CORCC|nr:hypothetical protein BS50DRAFT_501689 [Corynespora cassiicola Philippines]
MEEPFTPMEIVADHGQDYLVSWKPDDSGMQINEPSLISKRYIMVHFPLLIQAWEEEQAKIAAEGQQVDQKVQSLASSFFADPIPITAEDMFVQGSSASRYQASSVPCDQDLFPGTHRHWGPVRLCETHRSRFAVCHGCRVAQYMLPVGGIDRECAMKRGARVAVCAECADRARGEYGREFRGCICDTKWTCFRCREAEIWALAGRRQARARSDRCGQCKSEGRELKEEVQFCLRCEKFRIF